MDQPKCPHFPEPTASTDPPFFNAFSSVAFFSPPKAITITKALIPLRIWPQGDGFIVYTKDFIDILSTREPVNATFWNQNQIKLQKNATLAFRVYTLYGWLLNCVLLPDSLTQLSHQHNDYDELVLCSCCRRCYSKYSVPQPPSSATHGQDEQQTAEQSSGNSVLCCVSHVCWYAPVLLYCFVSTGRLYELQLFSGFVWTQAVFETALCLRRPFSKRFWCQFCWMWPQTCPENTLPPICSASPTQTSQCHSWEPNQGDSVFPFNFLKSTIQI